MAHADYASTGVTGSAVRIDPDATIPDLLSRLTDDSKRLVKDEVQLAKLETRENVRVASRGALWLGVAFGFAVVALVAVTVFLTAVIGRLAGGNVWVGAVVTGILELLLAAFLVKRGIGAFKEPDYTLGESREEIRETAAWVSNPRSS